MGVIMKTSKTLVQAFQSALAERSSHNGKPSEAYMLGYIMGMLEQLVDDHAEAADYVQSHLNELNLSLREAK
jgi:hypothetical protein